MWRPWRGCKKFSDGCRHCYIHKGDAKRGIDTQSIVKTAQFDLPIAKNKNGAWRIKPNQRVFLCFSSDFFIEEADAWRTQCWQFIKQRPDLEFLFLTKRIHRFFDCIPEDWGEGYPNVAIGCTIESQAAADARLPLFSSLAIAKKYIICQPLLTPMRLEPFLSGIEQVVVGGESDKNARPLDFDWVLDIRSQCVRQKTAFEFRQCGTHFVKDGKQFTLPVKLLGSQARKANINYDPKATPE